MKSKEELLNELFNQIGISLDKRQECQFIKYFELLVSWNEKMNLTSITDYEDVCLKHFVDSLTLIKLFESQEDFISSFSGKSLIDVGSGAGFPGIPIKILIPDCKITLIDSLDKRIGFLNNVISELDLKDIVAVHGRVEDFALDKNYRESFDIATARAVAALPVLSEYCLPFVKLGGSFIAMKSEKAKDELFSSKNALSILGGNLIKEEEFLLPGSDQKRVLLLFNKVKSTPKQYPRKAGTPSRKPL